MIKIIILFSFGALTAANAQTSQKCENTAEVQFIWDWCSNQNLTKESGVKEICFGTVVDQDIVYGAIQTLNSDGDYQCLYADGEWEQVDNSDCDLAISRSYTAVYGVPDTTSVMECTKNDEVISVSGATLLGEQFKFSKPE